VVKRRPLKVRPWRGASGSGPEVWRKLAEARLRLATASADDLRAIGLDKMPATLDDLKRAYRAAMIKLHPDLGGTDDEAIRASLAYARLKKLFKESDP